ncbi:MAG: hypothetical protein KA116_07670 [Proteobacteria bacterium]|nr:hypothetical protein [Pseudomonadota bacterium]
MKSSLKVFTKIMYLALSLTTQKVLSDSQDDSLLKLRQRMKESPKLYSLDDRLKLRQELIRRKIGNQSIYDNHQASYYALQGMEKSIRQTEMKKKQLGMLKGFIKVNQYAISTMVAVGSAGTAAPAIGIVNGGINLVMDPIFGAVEGKLNENNIKLVKAHLGKMPKGTLKSKAEAVASLKQMYGVDVLLSDLPKYIQDEMNKNPGLKAAYDKERNERIDSYLAGVGEDILDLQGQSMIHDKDIADLKKSFNTQAAAFTKFSFETKTRLNNLEHNQQLMMGAFEEVNMTLSKHEVKIEQNTHDINFMKNWMAGKMSNEELLEAARSGVISLSEKELNKTQLLAKVDAFKASSTQVLTIARDFAVIGPKLGLDPETAETITKVANYAEGGVQIATSLITGNIFGAVSVVASFFSGPDIGTLRHEQIMKSLEKIEELQIKILENQMIISKQIQEVQETLLKTRQDILDKLSDEFKRVHINMASIQNLVTEIAKDSKLDPCNNVVARYNQTLSANPRELYSENSFLKLYSDNTMISATKNCRDNFVKLYFDSSQPGNMEPTSAPNKIFVHGVSTISRTEAETNKQWNSDQDFYALSEILESFHALNDKLPSLDQVFVGLQSETPNVNSILLREQISSDFKNTPEWLEYFKARMQPEIVVEIAEQFRKMYPLLNRVSTEGFLNTNDLSAANTLYIETRNNNLKVAHAIHQQLKIAEAQERLVGGSFVVPLLIRFIRDSKNFFKNSPHTQKEQLILKAAYGLARVFEHNPYLVHNAAIMMMSQTNDLRMNFDRAYALESGELDAPLFNKVFAQDYEKAFNSGDLNKLRTLVPRDWKVICENQRDSELSKKWESTFDANTQCQPNHLGEYSYTVRMRGFADLSGDKVDPKLNIFFPLPEPQSVEDEALFKTASLIHLESASQHMEDLMMQYQSLKQINENTLRSFDETILGGLQ